MTNNYACFIGSVQRFTAQVNGRALLWIILLYRFEGQRDKLNADVEELKKKEKATVVEKEATAQRANELEMRLQVLKSQYEGKIVRLEKELKELKEAKEEKEKKVEELQKKHEELQQSTKA